MLLRWAAEAAVLGAAADLAPVSRAGVVYRTVALPGMQAPGAPPGALFSQLDAPAAIDGAGGAGFVATIGGGGVTASNNTGIWSEGSGALSLVAREGDHAPGTPAGATFGEFIGSDANLVLNAAGRAVFAAFLPLTGGVTNANNTGIWSNGSGALALAAREGDPAPGTPAGVNFGNMEPSLTKPVMNASGQIAFRAELAGGGVTTSNNTGIWSGATGALALVARAGDAAPGTPAGVNFGHFAFDNHPVINAAGKTAFRGNLVGSGVTVNNNSGIWSEGSGSLALVAREGSEAPGTSGANFSDFGFSPVISAAGWIAFRGNLVLGGSITSDNDTGIWSEGPSGLTLVARKGSQAPGAPPGALFSQLDAPAAIDGAGGVGFVATIGGGGVTASNNTGIWSEGSGTLSLLVREGEQAPGTPTGTLFVSFAELSMNDSGAVAFRGSATGMSGIWAQDETGAVQLVVRSGQQFEVSPGVLRTIQSLDFLGGSGGADGRATAFNDDFTLAFYAGFTDGSEGVFTALVTAVPETSAFLFGGLAITVASVGTIVARRRRRATTTAGGGAALRGVEAVRLRLGKSRCVGLSMEQQGG